MSICCILLIVVTSPAYSHAVASSHHVISPNLPLRVPILDTGGGDIRARNFIGEVKVRGALSAARNRILSFSIGYSGEALFHRGALGLQCVAR